MDTNDMRRENPNVHVRLRLSRKGPGLPKRDGYMDIWMKGTEFRVRDETGRFVYEILGDIAAKRGLGQAPRTIEEIMDISSRFGNEAERGATELIGDTATNQGMIHEPGKAPWTIEAKEIAPVARQIFTDGLEEKLEPVKTITQFRHSCIEYHGFVEGKDDNASYKNEIARIVSPPSSS